MPETIVPDTSVIVDGKLTDMIRKERLSGAEIIVSNAVVEELEQQANEGREIGYAGLDELEELHELADRYSITVRHAGRRPTGDEIERAEAGGVDALIRDLAEEEGATLYTADAVQHRVAKAKGVPVKFFPKSSEEGEAFSLRNYFEEDIASVHLKEGDVPKAKRGEPGALEYTPIGDDELSRADLERLMKETIEQAENTEKGLVELDMEGSTVLQIGDLRIVMTQPPFSEAREITAVRPIATVDLDDYALSDALRERLQTEAEGILIAGSPGHGKSTFAQALSEFYSDAGEVVKTMEHPRDLQVGPDITQYSPLEEEMENTGDVLLLVRPDYTVYDEVRKTEDFDVFADMRLAGVGMIGVVHASEALDAIQRMIGRVELGVIPQVVDTVVFIENMEVAKVYKLVLTVKVPEGMTEADLARPVIQVKDFEQDETEYEIYTYGEETVVIPVEGGGAAASPTQELARKQLEHELGNYANNPVVEFEGQDAITVYFDDGDVGQLIGHQGETIDKIEEELGVSISVEPRSESGNDGAAADGGSVNYHLEDQGDQVVILVDDTHMGEDLAFYDAGEFLFSATVGKGGRISLSSGSEFADQLRAAHASDSLAVELS